MDLGQYRQDMEPNLNNLQRGVHLQYPEILRLDKPGMHADRLHSRAAAAASNRLHHHHGNHHHYRGSLRSELQIYLHAGWLGAHKHELWSGELRLSNHSAEQILHFGRAAMH